MNDVNDVHRGMKLMGHGDVVDNPELMDHIPDLTSCLDLFPWLHLDDYLFCCYWIYIIGSRRKIILRDT